MKTELIPVIHMVNQNQVMTNFKTCVESGVQKIFIINHQTTSNGTYYCKVYRKVGNGHYEYDLARYKENEIEIIKSYQWKR
jgi:hypothetical protein